MIGRTFGQNDLKKVRYQTVSYIITGHISTANLASEWMIYVTSLMMFDVIVILLLYYDYVTSNDVTMLGMVLCSNVVTILGLSYYV